MIYKIGIALILLLYCWFLIYKRYKEIDNQRWDIGIKMRDTQLQKLRTGWKPGDPILYIPRIYVGYWKSDRDIDDSILTDTNRELINELHKHYNLVLYVPKSDKDNVRVEDILPTIDYIENHQLPICFVTQKLPSKNVLEEFRFNYGNRICWLTRYKGV